MPFVLRFVENHEKFGLVNYDSCSNSATSDKKMLKI